MSVLQTRIDRHGPEFSANAAVNRAWAIELQQLAATVREGGPAAARAQHESRDNVDSPLVSDTNPHWLNDTFLYFLTNRPSPTQWNVYGTNGIDGAPVQGELGSLTVETFVPRPPTSP